MRYGSVCSGVEAATLAWRGLGWKPAFFSEIEPFPRAVLAARWPEVPLHGDFTTIEGDEYGAIDLLVGGTPCQSFSLAGLRGGLADDRGNLALEYILLADRKRPRWLVWENVPGVFTSCRDVEEHPDAIPGEDFAAFLSGLVRWDVPVPAGGWQNSGVISPAPVDGAYGVAWGVLDAKHFGVPQRRRRVFVVGYLGDWRRPAGVLLEPHCLSGAAPPERAPGQGLSGVVAGGAGEGGEVLTIPGYEISPTLGAGGHGPNPLDLPLAIAFAVRGRDDGAVAEVHEDGDTVGTLRAASGGSTRDYLAVFSVYPEGGQGADLAATEIFLAPSLTATAEAAMTDRGVRIVTPIGVRRLTPREGERLQGMPDDHTRIPWGGLPAEECPPTPRNRAIGNSMAVDVMRWIGERIAAVEAIACP